MSQKSPGKASLAGWLITLVLVFAVFGAIILIAIMVGLLNLTL